VLFLLDVYGLDLISNVEDFLIFYKCEIHCFLTYLYIIMSALLLDVYVLDLISNVENLLILYFINVKYIAF
jgi:hypothetical protein